MKIFSYLYDKTLKWSKHRKAPYYLAGMSFAESSFFPIPPDVMLMPMCLAKPTKAYKFALITTVFSLLGGLFGYLIGFTLIEILIPFFEQINYLEKYNKVAELFSEYGFWVVFIAGFSPIPYKLFTIAAGASAMALLPFIIASFIGRGARFFLVAFLMKVGGEKFEPKIRKSVDALGYALIVIITIYIVAKYV
jgi:membrane protein YqaA with SNARE-associated domain